MSLPHAFPSVCDIDKQILIIAGAGLSVPTLPAIDGFKPQLDRLAQSLNVPLVDDFFELSQGVLSALQGTGLTDGESRLELAEKLGLLDDQKWFGKSGLPLRGNTPRHRAIARLAVEERLRAIITLNWDALLEVGLESVGLETTRARRPWRRVSYSSVVRDTDLPKLANPGTVPILKPHGCVRDLLAIREAKIAGASTGDVIFKLTSSDFESATSSQNLVDLRVQSFIAECPLIAISWKIGEPSLRKTLLATALAANHQEVDAFTLASRTWYDNSHDEVAAAYRKTRATAFARVDKEAGDPTLDSLFQWLFARFAISQIAGACRGAVQGEMNHLLDAMDEPRDDNLSSWTDGWLPAWVRLCWRVGAMIGFDPATNQPIEASDIPLGPQDLHVPMTGLALQRVDLAAAGLLLSAIRPVLKKLDFERFPGGLYYSDGQLLGVALPGWCSSAEIKSLAGLKPLLDSMHGFGFIRAIKLIWLDPSGGIPSEHERESMREMFVAQMPSAGLALGSKVEWMALNDFVGEVR